MAGFDINRSRIGQDSLAEFLAAPLPTDLHDVPGIGPATVKSLRSFDIYNPHQLVGCFLRVCGEGMNSTKRCNAFWFLLKAMNVPGGTRSTIVHAIAEKVEIMIPGTYDTEFGGESEDDDQAEALAGGEFMIPDLNTSMENNYLALVSDAFVEDGLPTHIQVYDKESFRLIKHLTRDAILSTFMISKRGLLYFNDEGDDDTPPQLVLSEAVLLNYCHDTGTPIPEFSTLNIINQKD